MTDTVEIVENAEIIAAESIAQAEIEIAKEKADACIEIAEKEADADCAIAQTEAERDIKLAELNNDAIETQVEAHQIEDDIKWTELQNRMLAMEAMMSSIQAFLTTPQPIVPTETKPIEDLTATDISPMVDPESAVPAPEEITELPPAAPKRKIIWI